MADRGHTTTTVGHLMVAVFGYLTGYLTGYMAVRNKKVCPACTADTRKCGEEAMPVIRPRMLGRNET